MKILIIGGFMESEFTLSYVARAIQAVHPKADASFVTFADAVAKPDEIQVRSQGAIVLVHSSGCLLAESILAARRVFFVSPSLAHSRTYLFIRAAYKTGHHIGRMLFGRYKKQALRILFSNTFELVSSPLSNFRPYVNGAISQFDLTTTLTKDTHLAKMSTIVLTSEDEMFRHKPDTFTEAIKAGATLKVISGTHDEVFLQPETVLKQLDFS